MRGLFILVVPAGLATYVTLTERPPYAIVQDWMLQVADPGLLEPLTWLVTTLLFAVAWLLIVSVAFSTSAPTNHKARTSDNGLEAPVERGPEAMVLAVFGLGFMALAGWGYVDGMTAASSDTFIAGGAGVGFMLCAGVMFLLGSN